MQCIPFLLVPLTVGGSVIERVVTYKLLGVYIFDDLSRNFHIEHIVKKANKRLYALPSLIKSGLTITQLLQVYCSIVRFVLEYACPAKVFRGRYRICTKKGPTHRFAELSLWRRPNSIWHHCPFPEKGGAWLPVVSGTKAINSLCVNWQAMLPPFRRTCSVAPCPQDKAVRRFLHH